MKIVYYVVAHASGWRVRSRGFTWDLPTLTEAAEFACTMAQQYALASGHATAVRLQDADGGFDEVKSFGGIVPLRIATATQTTPVRRS